MYMEMKHLAQIAARFIAAGRDPEEPVAIVTRATAPDQQVLETTLARAAADAEAGGLTPPAVICVGRVVLMRQVLDWVGQMAGEPVRALDPLGRSADET
jgi:uroporphyrin-III C-methyltransferase